MPFGVHSEVGRLRQVMVHRPGLEHSRLTPSNAEELLGLEHLDATFSHHLTEHVVLGLRLLDPQHVVEEQLLGVRRGEARVFQARPVHHDAAQPAYLGISSQWHGGLLCSSGRLLGSAASWRRT